MFKGTLELEINVLIGKNPTILTIHVCSTERLGVDVPSDGVFEIVVDMVSTAFDPLVSIHSLIQSNLVIPDQVITEFSLFRNSIADHIKFCCIYRNISI